MEKRNGKMYPIECFQVNRLMIRMLTLELLLLRVSMVMIKIMMMKRRSLLNQLSSMTDKKVIVLMSTVDSPCSKDKQFNQKKNVKQCVQKIKNAKLGLKEILLLLAIMFPLIWKSRVSKTSSLKSKVYVM